MGGRGQWLAPKLAERFGQVRTLWGLAFSSIVNAIISAAIGFGLATIMPVPGRMLFLALALLLCGGSMLLKAKPPADPGERGGIFTVIVTSLALQLGDRGQFLITGIACAFPHAALAAVGGAIGTFGALLLPAVMGREFAVLPVATLSWVLGLLFLIIGFLTAVSVFGLI